MFAIRNYTDTKCELELAKTRLSLLVERKEKLYCKYFPVTSRLKEDLTEGGEQKDKMTEYLYELHEIDYGTGKSLHDEIIEQQELVKELKKYLKLMNKALSKLSGIEYQLFYEIVYNKVKITQAVDNIAIKHNMDASNIWKNHYKKIKKYIKKLNSPVICQ